MIGMEKEINVEKRKIMEKWNKKGFSSEVIVDVFGFNMGPIFFRMLLRELLKDKELIEVYNDSMNYRAYKEAAKIYEQTKPKDEYYRDELRYALKINQEAIVENRKKLKNAMDKLGFHVM